jgi:glycosyltransferase involved in cell wall biosynthesis
MPTVTIGIPFRNPGHYLVEAIRSVFCQTFSNWQLLLLDDGSSDDSLRIAKSVQDPRIRVISDGVNRGLVYRLNQAVSLAEGELLARMDADDLMHPERLARQVQYLRSHRDVDLVGTGFYAIDTDNRAVSMRSFAARLPRMGLQHGYMHPTLTGRTTWFRANPYDPAYPRAEDLELWYRTQSQTVGHNLDEVLYFYREVGCCSIRKYRESCRTERRILRRYGPGVGGRLWTLSRVATSYGKQLTYACFVGLGAENQLIRRRGRPLTDGERRIASEIIQVIVQTPVPGFATGTGRELGHAHVVSPEDALPLVAGRSKASQ